MGMHVDYSHTQPLRKQRRFLLSWFLRQFLALAGGLSWFLKEVSKFLTSAARLQAVPGTQ